MKNETARREIESLDYYLQNHTNDYSEKSHTAMMMAIEALEQEPVKHGEWEFHNYSNPSNAYQGYYICSNCRKYEHAKYTYCPNCGAKMDNGGDTE